MKCHGTYVGYAERNSASEAAIHKLQNPAVTRPILECYSVSFEGLSASMFDLPQMTLVLPPDVRLIDRLAERAVHD